MDGYIEYVHSYTIQLYIMSTNPKDSKTREGVRTKTGESTCIWDNATTDQVSLIPYIYTCQDFSN